VTTAELVERWRRHEGPLGDPGTPPPVWQRAQGSHVWDADGRRYLDLSSGFGVAAVGHANPRVVEAVRAQAGELLHGLGDLHPTAVRIRLAERLASVAPFGLTRALWSLTGAGAVELALKTALLATGRSEVIAFRGGSTADERMLSLTTRFGSCGNAMPTPTQATAPTMISAAFNVRWPRRRTEIDG